MSIPPDLADLIRLNPENAYDQGVVHQLQRLVNGDPWGVITQIAVINNSVNQDRLFDLIVPNTCIESTEITPLSNELLVVEPSDFGLLPDGSMQMVRQFSINGWRTWNVKSGLRTYTQPSRPTSSSIAR